MKIALCTLADIRSGRGVENVIFNLLKYRPSDIRIVLIQTDKLFKKRVSDDFVKSLLKDIEVITIHRHNITFNSRFLRVIEELIIRPAILDYKLAVKQGKLRNLTDIDLAYLFYNHYSIFFKNYDIPIIGSNHTDSLMNPEANLRRNLRKRIYLWFYYKIYFKIYYKYLNGYHAFPKNAGIFNFLDFKYKMILPNGVDTSLYHPDFEAEDGKVTFFFNAALRYEKGLDIIFPMLDILSDEDVEFHIAGSGELEEIVRSNKKIIYHGVPDNEELARLYRTFKVFVYPSRDDNFAIVVLQALASGMYVLAGNFLKGVFDEFEGKYLEYLDMNPESFAGRIREILANPKKIDHDKKSEYQYVKENYDWSKIALKFYDYLRRFVSLDKQ